MKFRFPKYEILEAAVVMWYERAKLPDVRLDHLFVDVLTDNVFTAPGEVSRRQAVLTIDDLNEPESAAGLLHVYMRLLVGNEADDGTPLPDTWQITSMMYEYDEVIRPIKVTA